jgi:hypothetical protein
VSLAWLRCFPFHCRYFSDYNTLESTFLICGIMVLLGGLAYSVAEFSEPVYYTILEYIVLTMVVVSTVVCLLTILTELGQSVKYFAAAQQANRRVKVRFPRQPPRDGFSDPVLAVYMVSCANISIFLPAPSPRALFCPEKLEADGEGGRAC